MVFDTWHVFQFQNLELGLEDLENYELCQIFSFCDDDGTTTGCFVQLNIYFYYV